MKKNKKNIFLTSALFIVSIVFTISVKFLDVKSIGPNGTSVGLSAINEFVSTFFKPNLFIYKISSLLGYLLMLLMIIYAFIGLYQLIKRKSLYKVDRNIIIMGLFYILLLVVYIFFEKLEINYRPVLIKNELEPSYPSSHTILSLCVGLSSLIVSKKYFNKKYIKTINLITVVISVMTLLLRLFSGVHWFTDIIGGIIISSFLVSLFNTIYKWNN